MKKKQLTLLAVLALLTIVFVAAGAAALQSEIHDEPADPVAIKQSEPSPQGQYVPEPGEYVSSVEETKYGLPAMLFIVLVGLGVYLLIVRSTNQGGR